MSDRIYADDESFARENVVLVAQSADSRKLLTKRNYPTHQLSYDNVFKYNFFEIHIDSLDELYSLSKRMLDKPQCCFIRARIKDLDNRRNVQRKYKDEDATLVLENCNWFALDIDWKDKASSGDLVIDSQEVLLALPSCFAGVECFVVASASYGIKPGIRMRMFFWAQHPVSNLDLKRCLSGYEKICDPAIFNPIQPIYTAKPIFNNMDDPVSCRIATITPLGIFSQSVEIKSEPQHYRGAPEIIYTKRRAEQNAFNHYERIKLLSPGERHEGLKRECIPLGKLVGQNHFDRETVIDNAYEACSHWTGRRDTKKDKETITWAVDLGISAMSRGN